jgi:parallel beta-helix repeat protein
MKRNALALSICAVAMLALCTSARAAGGIIEINQAVVNAAGGFPYNITAPGSYRLSGNLTVTATNTNAINLNVNSITLDLNGFSITGPGSGSGDGIFGYSGMTVKNGTVGGFGVAVFVGANSIVRDVLANNNSDGIIAGASSTVQGCTTNSNSGIGVQCGNTCAVSANTANNNGSLGILCSNDCTISGNTADTNFNDGIRCTGNACTVSANTANSSTGASGIECDGNGCVISGNTVTGNTDSGIYIAGSSALIIHNAIYGNGLGINANDATTAYGENVLDNNSANSFGTSMKNNVCNGSATLC